MGAIRRIANIFRTERHLAEVDEEIAFHLAERAAELEAAGLSREEARREARRRFGNLSRQREETRDMDIARRIEALLQDLRYGARQLRLNPGFTAVAVLSLALGIGANLAMFQLINALRLRSLPIEAAGQLATVRKPLNFMTAGWSSGRHDTFTYAQFEQMREHQEAFDDLTAFGTTRFNLSPGGEVRKVDALYVAPNFLAVLGVRPVLGGWLDPATDPHDCGQAGALLDYEFWQREYAGDPAVVGRTLTLNGQAFPVLGVTPRSFGGVEPERRFDVAVPLCADSLMAAEGEGRLTMRTAWWLTPIGRLRADWSVERASAHFRDLSPGIFRETLPTEYRPDTAERYLENKIEVAPAANGVSSLRDDYEKALWILFAATGLVLLIACANLANLLLARASVREREVAMRQALGASRGRIISQLMAESGLLALLGGAAGAAVAYGLSRALVSFLSGGGSSIDMALGMDWRILSFTVVTAAGACLLFGLAPAMRASGGDPADAMRGGRGSTAGAGHQGLRSTLAVIQIALSFVLLAGALLLAKSLDNVLSADIGIDSDGVVLASLESQADDYDLERSAELSRQLVERVRALPEVSSAAFVSISPFSGSGWNSDVYAADDPTDSDDAFFTRVGPGYFETMGTPLVAGREFTARDDLSAPRVAIINRKTAERFWGEGVNPVGRVFRIEAGAGEADEAYEVVGVVENTKYYDLREEDRELAFFPIAQENSARADRKIVMRVSGPVNRAEEGFKQAMAAIDPELLVEFEILERQIARTTLRDRLMANLSSGFGVLAAALAALGLYGVMSYMVARRRREIGVRMALGAERGAIRGLVLGEVGKLTLVGLTIGLAGSLVLSRTLESILFGLEPHDPAMLGLGCGLLLATALAAALVPVRRATRVDPAVVLREE